MMIIRSKLSRLVKLLKGENNSFDGGVLKMEKKIKTVLLRVYTQFTITFTKSVYFYR